jgi:hypothetical protein
VVAAAVITSSDFSEALCGAVPLVDIASSSK